MTRADAIAAAKRDCGLFGLAMAVYRLPAWPPDVYGARASHKLPPEAQRLDEFTPPPAERAAAAAVPQLEAVADDGGAQGRLF
jgi:hypothetical protein